MVLVETIPPKDSPFDPLTHKFKLIERVYSDPSLREKLLQTVINQAQQVPQKADCALMLGTSYQVFPEKFTRRVETAVELYRTGKVNSVMFSGATDNETHDRNQGEEARDMAIGKFGLATVVSTTVGGNNTIENIAEALNKTHQLPIRSFFVVSDPDHLLRTYYPASYMARSYSVQVFPYPTESFETLDPNNPRIIRELLKMTAYNRVLNKTDKPIYPHIRARIDEEIIMYEKRLGLRN